MYGYEPLAMDAASEQGHEAVAQERLVAGASATTPRQDQLDVLSLLRRVAIAPPPFAFPD